MGNILLGARSEERALAALAAACSTALSGFPTTLEDDEALLRSGSLGPLARNCVVMLIGEKQVLLRLRAAVERGRDGEDRTRLAEDRTACAHPLADEEAWQA